jgi:hypothetical protein
MRCYAIFPGGKSMPGVGRGRRCGKVLFSFIGNFASLTIAHIALCDIARLTCKPKMIKLL